MLVLASSSPRRHEMLRNAGIAFVAEPADIPEIQLPGEAPQAFAERTAKEKAVAVWQRWPDGEDLILGADTIVVVDNEILGKPSDAADAARMLHLLSGRTHQVTTGVCLMGRGVSNTRSATTRVQMEAWNDAEIQAYVASGEPMDKAGAYAIQGRAARWISRIEGDYCNVVGLPLWLVCQMLDEQGWEF